MGYFVRNAEVLFKKKNPQNFFSKQSPFANGVIIIIDSILH